MASPDKIKDNLFQLHSLIATVPKPDNLIIFADFIANVGCDSISWERVIGKHGHGNGNSNGLLILRTCARHGLFITNIVFCLPTRSKTSWMHPRSKHCLQAQHPRPTLKTP
ncbi:hypothetical protein ACOMHN_045056 [Nucella lapillus]